MANIFRHAFISEEITYVGQVLPTLETHIHATEKEDDSRHREEEDKALWQSGYTEGIANGASQERTLLKENNHTLNALLQSIPQAINENRQQLSSEIADIVLLIVNKFFIHQQQNKESIAHQINQIIGQINEKQTIELLLHPHDLELIKQGEIHLVLRAYKNIRLKADENLRLGGCIVNSEHGVFDAGIERQIDNLKQVLLKMKHGAIHA